MKYFGIGIVALILVYVAWTLYDYSLPRPIGSAPAPARRQHQDQRDTEAAANPKDAATEQVENPRPLLVAKNPSMDKDPAESPADFPKEELARLEALAELVPLQGIDPNALAESLVKLAASATPDVYGVYSTGDHSLIYPLKGFPDGVEGNLLLSTDPATLEITVQIDLAFVFEGPRWAEEIPRRAAALELSVERASNENEKSFFLAYVLEPHVKLCKDRGFDLENTPYFAGIGYWMYPDGEILHKKIFRNQKDEQETSDLLPEAEPLSAENQNKIQNLIKKLGSIVKPEEFR